MRAKTTGEKNGLKAKRSVWGVMGKRPILSPRPKQRRSSITLSESLWEELDRIATETHYARDEVVERFLRWACEEWREQQKGEKPH
jgi:hypothetical protein